MAESKSVILDSVTFQGHAKTLDLTRVGIAGPEMKNHGTMDARRNSPQSFGRDPAMTAPDRQTVNLLRAVVATRLDGRAEKLAQLAAHFTSWEEVLASAKRHGIVPTLYSSLAACGDLIPASAQELLQREF